jgi:hypothetical protein
MMTKRLVFYLIAATLVMAFHSREGMAEEIICISPTTTSGVTIPPDWHGDPAIYAEKWTISRGEGIALWCVCGEGPLCPEYQWSVSGNGFHFDSSAGPTTGETQKQFEIIELWADNTACGTATVTVIDNCGKTDTGYIRCDRGHWQSPRNDSVAVCVWGDCGTTKGNHVCGGVIIHPYRYWLRWYSLSGVKYDCGSGLAAELLANDYYDLNAVGSCTYMCDKKNRFISLKNSTATYKPSISNGVGTLRIMRVEWVCP